MNHIRVVLRRSTIGISRTQLACVTGLGLRRIGHERVLENTPSVRGMIKKVIHLVDAEEVE
jgi:large subunit ribosomal protein L30